MNTESTAEIGETLVAKGKTYVFDGLELLERVTDRGIAREYIVEPSAMRLERTDGDGSKYLVPFFHPDPGFITSGGVEKLFHPIAFEVAHQYVAFVWIIASVPLKQRETSRGFDDIVVAASLLVDDDTVRRCEVTDFCRAEENKQSGSDDSLNCVHV